MILQLGETHVYGKTRDNAVALLDACKRLGVPREVVRATDSGFIVPNAVADEVSLAEAPGWAPEGATL